MIDTRSEGNLYRGLYLSSFPKEPRAVQAYRGSGFRVRNLTVATEESDVRERMCQPGQ